MSERYFEIRGKKIRYIDNNVKGNRKLILFHGARFNANTWLTTGTLQYLETEGIPSLAVDFPGYGKSETGWDDLAEFIKDLIAESELETPVLLGPSMGGNAVLRYALRYDRVSGLVLVGAVGVKEVEKDIKKLSNTPTLLVWGAKDNVSSIENAKVILNNSKAAKLEIIGSQHACYLDDPERFNQTVSSFVKHLLQ